MEGKNDDGQDEEVTFCIVDGKAKVTIGAWLSAQYLDFKPTFIRITGEAEKDLSPYSMYPTLGKDSTLPQFRASHNGTSFLPLQDQYPVWYFFYGTLANLDVLSRHLALNSAPDLRQASVYGGVLQTWARKYHALVDGRPNSRVDGSAYLVETREHEDALRAYETGNYEVVRCEIVMGEVRVMGCTFRFVGSVDEG